MDTWYPEAIRNPAASDGGSYVSGYPFRGVLHTTESHGFTPRPDSYGGWHTSYPHFTAVERSASVEIFQHIPIDRAARALRNPSGGVQTNRAAAIQIEIVGKASRSASMSRRLLEALAMWMRWVETQTGIRRIAPEFDGDEAFGQGGSVRFSAEHWRTFDGWCGHQHVPENDHWDPGRIPIELLLGVGAVPTPPSPPDPARPERLRVVGVEVGDVLNVRREPGVDAEPLGHLVPHETQVIAAGGRATVGSSTWRELALPVAGWVNDRYLEPIRWDDSLQVEHRVVLVDEPDRLNVRAAPGIDHPRIGMLEPGAVGVMPTGAVAAVGLSDWYELAVPVAGWAHSRYLESVSVRTRRAPTAEVVVVPDSDQYTHGDIG